MKTIVLDTNTMLHNWNVLKSFPDTKLIIPLCVLEELDKFKTAEGELGVNSRKSIQFLDEQRKKGRQLSDGVPMENGGTLFVIDAIEVKMMPFDTVDNQLVSTTAALDTASKKEKHNISYVQFGDEVMLLTKDINLRIKCDGNKVRAEDYIDIGADCSSYTGVCNLDIDPETCASLYVKYPEELRIDQSVADRQGLRLNEYVILTCEGKELDDRPAKYVGNGLLRFLPKEYHLTGIRHRNLEQRLAIDALLDDSVSLVTLKSLAGGGKSMLAVAAAIQKVFKDKEYDRIVITRPVVPLGNDLGFLPGGLAEKMAPWVAPILDQFKAICAANKGKGKNKLGKEIEENFLSGKYEDLFEIIPITYMRGRSIPRSYIIVDEAQNSTPSEMKTILTRIGEGSKVVLTGDPSQIDHRFLSRECNGLSMTINKFQGKDLYSHVTLRKSERSRLAEMAADILFEE